MPQFTIERRIEAPVEVVWSVLDDFGDIQRWNDGVKSSALTSEGPVAEGATRHCDLVPFGGVDERIQHYEPGQQMTVDIHSVSKLPMSRATADFRLSPSSGGTELVVDYEYDLNRLGRAMKGVVHGQLEKGIGGMVDGLAAESERIAGEGGDQH